MRKLSFILLVLISQLALSQYGSLELSSGGFSLVPAFTDTAPNFILNAGTSENKLLSAHLIGNVRVNGMNPRSFIFITRAKLLGKKESKLKLTAGIHLPVLQIDEDYHVQTYFAQEVIAKYPLSKKFLLNAMYIHGKGRNNDLEINLITLTGVLLQNKFSFVPQVYYLDLDRTIGVAQGVNYRLNPRFDLRGFLNYTITSNTFIGTFGIRYTF
jgi:hypothetical protein